MRDSPHYEVEMLAQGLPDGQSMRTVCPACQGGSDRERSLSITRQGGTLKWHCFRASCPYSGAAHGAAYATGGTGAGPPLHEPYRGAFNALETEDLAYFAKRFHLVYYPHSAIGYNEHGQYVFRVYGPMGAVRGYNVRRLPWGGDPVAPRTSDTTARPKTKLWMDREGDVTQSFHFPINGHNGQLYIVEDQLSALKVAQEGQIGAALLGDGMTIAKVMELQRLPGVKETYLALDKDASKRSFDIARQFGLALTNLRVLLLEEDIKDLSRAAVRTLMRKP